jgi:integrase
MQVQITHQAINKATRDAKADGRRRELADAGCRGLRIRITPAGSRGWILGARDRFGQARRFNLGSYPAMGIISYARDAARGLHYKVKHEGADPIADKRRNIAIGKHVRAGVGTLKAMLDTFENIGGPPKSWKSGRSRVELVFRKVLNRPCSMLTVGDLQLEADSYPFPKSAGFAVRTLRPVLNWASRPGRAYLSPDLGHLSSPAKMSARKRILSADELRAILPLLRASGRPSGAAMRFMLLTLSRRQEAALARWRDVDMDMEARTWTIPETKNGQPHVVPLSRQAMDLLRSRLAANEVSNPTHPDPSGLVFATSTGAPLGNWDRETKAVQAASGTRGWTRHDLRRTGATMLGEMGELPDIIEAALNHVSIRSSLAATYNRSRYRPRWQSRCNVWRMRWTGSRPERLTRS